MDKIFVVDAEILDDLRDDSSRFRLLFWRENCVVLAIDDRIVLKRRETTGIVIDTLDK